jgi:hypothetical protein
VTSSRGAATKAKAKGDPVFEGIKLASPDLASPDKVLYPDVGEVSAPYVRFWH